MTRPANSPLTQAFLRLTTLAGLLFASLAVAGQPKEDGKRGADLLELIKLDKTIKLDIRYATAYNFVGRPVYPEARAFLQRPAAEAVARVHKLLAKEGLGIVVFDGYRPWSITKLFWEVVRDDQKQFVADPAKGSKHNRGCAIDLSIYDRRTGRLVPMPSEYDEFTERASPQYAGGTDEQRANRDKLRRLMEADGFTVNPNEWWHFDFNGWENYAIYDLPFNQIRDLDIAKGFAVRRIEFFGNVLVRDREVRQVLSFREGDMFQKKDVSASIKRINAMGAFERMTLEDVSWHLDQKRRDIDFVFYLKEKKQ